MFSHLIGRGDVELLVGDINRPVVYSDSVDYIIHGASATSSKYFVSNPVGNNLYGIGWNVKYLKVCYRKKDKWDGVSVIFGGIWKTGERCRSDYRK